MRKLQNGYKDEKMFQKLGNAYYFNAQLEKAAKVVWKLFDLNRTRSRVLLQIFSIVKINRRL
jgi:hypothetical protein